MGIGDWGLGPIPNPQSPIPNPQSPIPIPILNLINKSVFELESEIYKTTQKSYIKLITQSNYISKGNKKLN